MADTLMGGRLLVLSVAVQEIARALSAAQATVVADAIRDRVECLATNQRADAADEGMTTELVPLLAALGSRT